MEDIEEVLKSIQNELDTLRDVCDDLESSIAEEVHKRNVLAEAFQNYLHS